MSRTRSSALDGEEGLDEDRVDAVLASPLLGEVGQVELVDGRPPVRLMFKSGGMASECGAPWAR